MARQAVDGPQIQEPGYSLLAAVQTLSGGDERDWFDGWQYRAAGCAGWDATWTDCGIWTGVDFSAVTKALIEGEPLLVRAWDRCSTMGGRWDLDAYRSAAEATLKSVQSAAIAREFWDGAVGNANSWPNVALTDGSSDVLTTTAVTPTEALAMVEQAMGPRRGMVHCTVQVLTHLVGAGVIRWEGGVWLTPMRNVVVADAGYSGNGPGTAAGTSQWIYGTGWVQVFLGRIETNPDSTEVGAALAPGNSIEYVVSRLAGLRFDQCTHVAAQVNVGVPAIGQLALAPSTPVGTNASLSSSISWTAPTNTGDTAITSYVVEVRNASTNALVTSTTSPSSPKVVTGLTAGVGYKARVAAVTSDGQGAFSALSATFTPTA